MPSRVSNTLNLFRNYASSNNPHLVPSGCIWLGPFLFELPHAFCGFAATLMRDRLLVHRAMIDGLRFQADDARAALVGAYRRAASSEMSCREVPELPGNLL
jgi:hypothetical protein